MALANFPGVGPTGSISINDFVNAQLGAQVTADGAQVMGGFLLYSILTELRLHSQMLQTIANISDNLATLRQDAVTDMGTIYVANPPTPVASS